MLRPQPRFPLFPYTTLFRSIGSLAMGKQADIVVIKGNPSTQIKDIENVEIVFKDGIGYDSAKLRSEEHTSELQSRFDLVCRLLLEKKKEYLISTIGYDVWYS